MSTPFAYEAKNAWETYSSPEDREKLLSFARRYKDFISCCKTERETVDFIRGQLEESGFSEKGNKIYRDLRGKALFAARRGTESLSKGLRIIAAHVDSPRLDLKQHPFIEQAQIAQAKTHYYGGIRKYQWLARPLALHGVIIKENGEKISVSIGENPGEPVFCVADLLPHLAQQQSKQKLSEAFDAEKLNIILGHEPAYERDKEEKKSKDAIKRQLLNFLHEKYSVSEEDFITAELEAVPAGKARFVGFDQALLGGYGQDDRICCFCALEALLNASPSAPGNLALIFWDKEEIGSDGASGASSRFFEYCVEELTDLWQADCRPSRILINSQALSADVTAGLDPDYQDVHEKNNAAKMGFGPCFSKFTGSRGKYGASEADAEFFASLRKILNRANIPWQAAELGKVDLGGGGTVAMFLAAYGMRVIDLGPALLSMHSPFEISSVADLYACFQAYLAFMEN